MAMSLLTAALVSEEWWRLYAKGHPQQGCCDKQGPERGDSRIELWLSIQISLPRQALAFCLIVPICWPSLWLGFLLVPKSSALKMTRPAWLWRRVLTRWLVAQKRLPQISATPSRSIKRRMVISKKCRKL